jgi:hypothetical protein
MGQFKLVKCILQRAYVTNIVVMCFTGRFVIILIWFVMYLPTVPSSVECVFTGILHQMILISIDNTV